jgi:hypothetical protein
VELNLVRFTTPNRLPRNFKLMAALLLLLGPHSTPFWSLTAVLLLLLGPHSTPFWSLMAALLLLLGQRTSVKHRLLKGSTPIDNNIWPGHIEGIS